MAARTSPPSPSPPRRRTAAAAWPSAESKPCLAQGFVLLWHEGSADATLAGEASDPVQLNATASAILRLCNGEHSVRRMVTELERLFDANGIAADVHAFLRESRDRGWLN